MQPLALQGSQESSYKFGTKYSFTFCSEFQEVFKYSIKHARTFNREVVKRGNGIDHGWNKMMALSFKGE